MATITQRLLRLEWAAEQKLARRQEAIRNRLAAILTPDLAHVLEHGANGDMSASYSDAVTAMLLESTSSERVLLKCTESDMADFGPEASQMFAGLDTHGGYRGRDFIEWLEAGHKRDLHIWHRGFLTDEQQR